MKEPDEIDLLFQSAFDGLELNPDPSVKDYIDHAIASKKKRRRFLFILFPVLFGAIGFAAILPFIQNEKQKKNEGIMHHTIQAITGAHAHSHATISSNKEGPFSGSPIKTNRSFAITKSIEDQSNFLFNPSTDKFISPDLPVDSGIETRTQEQLPQTNTTSEKLEDLNLIKQDSITAPENISDSTFASSLLDSTGLLISKELEKTGPDRGSSRWSLAVLTYWEGEKKRTVDFKNEPFINNKRELAAIHSATFYGKIELNRKIGHRWEVLTGIGFRSSKTVQYGYVSQIEIPIQGVSTGIPISIPDTVHLTEVQSFRVNSLVLPIGFAYSFLPENKLLIRLSGGAEFAYGQFAGKQLHPTLSAPAFHSFGYSIWLRPEVGYSFGKIRLVGFGTFNQSISQQLRWDFGPRRNPAFGGGIGLRFQL